MAKVKLGTIDIIARNWETGGFDLIVVDEGSIRDEVRRYTWMIEKLHLCLEFVHGGQFFRQYPDAKDKPIRCVVICIREPNDAMIEVEGIKDRNDPQFRFPVVVMTKDEYLKWAAQGKKQSGLRTDN